MILYNKKITYFIDIFYHVIFIVLLNYYYSFAKCLVDLLITRSKNALSLKLIKKLVTIRDVNWICYTEVKLAIYD